MDAKHEGAVRIGPAGWSYEDWKGIVYPIGMPRTLHPLTYLSEFFDTIEVNTTFYRPPLARQCASWIDKVAGNPRFLFTLKLWRRFTHERASWPDVSEIAAVNEGLAPLAETGKIGAVLIQFPWSFRRTSENRSWLARALDAFSAYPLAVEMRHASWSRPEVIEGLARRGVALCNIDQPLFRDSIAPSAHVTARVGYVRLHGRNYGDWFREDAGRDERYDYLYSRAELEPWIDKVRQIRQQAEQVFVITNNHYRGQAVVNALEMQAAIGRTNLDLPPQLLSAYPRLADSFPSTPASPSG